MGRILDRFLAALVLASTLAATAPPARCGEPAPIPGATWSSRGYEDRVLGFGLDRFPAPWAPGDWNGDWSGPLQAAVRMVHPTGAQLSVHATDSRGLTLQEIAAEMAFLLRVSAPRFEDLQPTTIAGGHALGFTATGDAQDERRPYHASIVVTSRDGLAFALASFVDGKERNPGNLEILTARFRFLAQGAFRRTALPVDVEGAGWRMRGGVVEHAFVGVRVPIPPGWRLAQDFMASSTVAMPSLNMESPFLGAGIRVDAIAIQDGNWGPAEQAAEALLGARYLTLKDPNSIPLPIRGSTLTLTWRLDRKRASESGDSKRYVLCGTVRGDGRVLVIQAHHPARRDPRVPPAIHDAFARLEILESPARKALVAALADQPDSQAFSGEGEFIRKGVFTSTSHRIVWRKPSPLWTFVPNGVMEDPEETLVVLQQEENITSARIVAFEGVKADNKWVLHEAIVEVFSAMFPGIRASRAVPSSLGSRDGVRTDLSWTYLGLPMKIVLITTNPASSRTYALLGIAKNEAAAIAELEAAVRGLRFQSTAILGPRRTPRGWEDPVYGFHVIVPSGLVQADSRPVSFAPKGGTVVEVASGGSRLVVAAHAWPFGEPELEAGAVDQVLSLLDPSGAAAAAYAKAADAPGAEGPVPSVERVLPGNPAVRIARYHAWGTLYVVGAAPAAGGGAEEVLSWFGFSD